MDGAHRHEELFISGGLCLLPGHGLVRADILCAEGRIARIGLKPDGQWKTLDAQGCLVLPGIVDIHGDAFERQIMPRPKTVFPLDVALLETDRQLAANGITTAYHGVTVSWEPGLRSLEQALRLIEGLDRLEPQFLVDHRIHIRWETFALDEMEAVQALFDRPRKPLLAFNDHTTPSLSGTRAEVKIMGSAERALLEPAAYLTLLDTVRSRAVEVPQAIRAMASYAREKGVVMLSHDDATPADRASFRALGVAIAEFPLNAETLDAAAEAGDPIVLGAPNVVRGGSHNGAIGAEHAIRHEKCSILASDYYYPAPCAAVLGLAERAALPFEQAWQLVSGAPAVACSLSDRGVIAEGMRADLILVPEWSQRPAATVSGGRIVFRSC